MSDPVIRPIEPRDDPAVAAIIREVMPSFGACGPGFAINDPEVDYMSRAYAAARSAYFVVEEGGKVIGGGGIAPLVGGDGDTCELRKMYFLPSLRGAGCRLHAICPQPPRAGGADALAGQAAETPRRHPEHAEQREAPVGERVSAARRKGVVEEAQDREGDHRDGG